MLVQTRHIAAPNRIVAGTDTQYGPDRVGAGAVVDQADSATPEYQLYAPIYLYFQSR